MPAASAGLIGGEVRPAEPLRPIRRQHTVRRAGDRILVDAGTAGEDATDYVGGMAGSGDDGEHIALLSERAEVRAKREHLLFRADDDQGIETGMPERLQRLATKRREHL